MQSTERYATPTTVAGAEREAVLAWMRRQAGWERRLRDLESDAELGSAAPQPRLRLLTPRGPRHDATDDQVRAAEPRARRAG